VDGHANFIRLCTAASHSVGKLLDHPRWILFSWLPTAAMNELAMTGVMKAVLSHLHLVSKSEIQGYFVRLPGARGIFSTWHVAFRI
jgi:hypothetical protein